MHSMRFNDVGCPVLQVGGRAGAYFDDCAYGGVVTRIDWNEQVVDMTFDDGDSLDNILFTSLIEDPEEMSDNWGPQCLTRPASELIERNVTPPVCSTCGYPPPKLSIHLMDRSKCSMLEAVAEKNRAGHAWAKVQRDPTLVGPNDQPWTILRDPTHATRCHWYRLLRTNLNRQGRNRTGEFQITKRGLAFLAGRLSVPQKIAVRDGRVYRRSQERVFIHQVRKVVLNIDYWDHYYLEQGY